MQNLESCLESRESESPILPSSADHPYAHYYSRSSILEWISNFAFHLTAFVSVDSDRLCLVIRACVFLTFHLQGRVDGLAHSRSPSVCVVEWKPLLSMSLDMWEKSMNKRHFHDSCQQDIFQMVSVVPFLWSGFIDPGTKRLPPYQICFLLSLLWKVLRWYGLFELSEARGNSLSKGLY